MEIRKEITQMDHIKLLVDSFYSKVRKDSILSQIFEERIKDNWPVHLDKMYRFWETILLETHSYQGSPFAPHATMPIDSRHFDRWLELFQSTLDEHFVGEKVDEAHWRASKMAEMFQMKLNYFRDNHSKPLV